MSDLQVTPRRRTPRRPKTDVARWRDVMKLLGYHVRRLRDFLQLSQAELAQRAGVSQGAISRVESGRHLDTPLVTYARVPSPVSPELRPNRH
jgi:DNA-binding XRE family transcriptional regulator